MDEMSKDTSLVNALAKYTGMAPSRMATEIGVAVTTLTRPASAKATTRMSRITLGKLRTKWPDFPGWSDQVADPEPNATPFQMEGAGETRMRRDIPVYGTALGADEVIEGEAVEQTELNQGNVVNYLRRPPILDGRADVYGLYVQGSSMSPRHRDGATLYVESRRRPSIGDDAVIYLRSPDGCDGERTTSVLVKTLVRKSASFIELEQYTPPIIFRIDMARVERMDRVLTLDDLIN